MFIASVKSNLRATSHDGNQSPELEIIATTFPAVHELTHNLKITILVIAIAVDTVERA
jgi:hypothetical protein